MTNSYITLPLTLPYFFMAACPHLLYPHLPSSLLPPPTSSHLSPPFLPPPTSSHLSPPLLPPPALISFTPTYLLSFVPTLFTSTCPNLFYPCLPPLISRLLRKKVVTPLLKGGVRFFLRLYCSGTTSYTIKNNDANERSLLCNLTNQNFSF